MSRPTSVIVSSAGLITVLSYHPSEGEVGVPISVHIDFHHPAPEKIFLRLKVGSTAVSTQVSQISPEKYGGYQLHATIPPRVHDQKVALSVEAVDADNIILDAVCFGEFTYWEHHLPVPNPPVVASQVSVVASQSVVPSQGPVLRRRANTTASIHNAPSAPSPTLSDRRPTSRRIRANSLMRANRGSPEDIHLHPQTPILQIITPLDTMCTSWDAAENRIGRRLVRFHKVQDGCKLIVSCEAIRQDDYCETDTVISCIFRDDNSLFYVTSVDIIYLLERLTNDDFPVEEKNRIRRNLEGLRPTTVSKHKHGFESFFQRIMEFPDPKPRNIEKDLKVFEWSLLGQALDKILSKYSIYTSDSPTDSTTSLPADPPSVDSRLYHDPLPIADKFEPLPDTILFSASHDSSGCVTPAEPVYDYNTSWPGPDQHPAALALNDLHSLTAYPMETPLDFYWSNPS
ncbi:hypothetical protein EDD85DRAFT_820900 [Armillaria nabsnona]|nr:hypothetical protein EDD85DRAFT_820900 [Armillaria nabsnona]